MTIPPSSIAIIGETVQQGPRTLIGQDKLFPILTRAESIIDVSKSSIVVPLNTAPITITNFVGGQDGQEIRILGDGFTSIANNSTIHTSTGATELLVTNAYYSFLLYKNIWYEHIDTTTSGSGGGGGTGPVTITGVPFGIPFEFGDAQNSLSSNVVVGGYAVGFACDITQSAILGDVSGSAQVDIQTAPNSGSPFTTICGSAKPTLTSQLLEIDSVLNTWTKHINAGTFIRAVLLSFTTVKKVTVTLDCTRSIP